MPVNSTIPGYIQDCIRSLPPLPAAVSKLLALARDPDADFRKITTVIETDQTLTVRTLKAANSALYGQPRRVETVQRATALLGRETLLSLAVGASITSLQHSLKRAWPSDPVTFWRHSVAVATAARSLARRLRSIDPETAFVAGLVHDIGKLIMLNHFGDLYAQVLLAAQYGTRPLHLLEQEFVETDHAVVGYALCLHWNLPASLTQAVAEHHDPGPAARGALADVIRDANDLVKMIRFGDSGNRFAELRPAALLPHNQIPPGLLREMLVHLPVEIREAERLFGDALGQLAPAADPTPRYIVHLKIDSHEERDLLSFLLLSRRCEPVPLDGAHRSQAPEDAELIGCVSDGPIDAARAIAYAARRLPVLDYATWRLEHGQPTADAYLNVDLLNQWLERELVVPPSRDDIAASGDGVACSGDGMASGEVYLAA